jgi:hypothetical protein
MILMKKSKLALLLLVLVLAFCLVAACGGNNYNGNNEQQQQQQQQHQQQQQPDVPAVEGFGHLVGQYYVDLSPGGMPMIVFLEIRADESFELTNAFEGGDSRGAGVIAGLDGTYMLLYDNDSRATFTVENGDLVFSTNLPFGTVNIGFPDQDIVAVRILDDRSNLPGTIDPAAGMIAALAGEYFVDLADLGMPMVFYLIIEEDGNFTLTNALVDGEIRNSGAIEMRHGGYSLVYDDDDGTRIDFGTTDGVLIFPDRLLFGNVRVGSDEEGVNVYAQPVDDDYVPAAPGMPPGMGQQPPETLPAGAISHGMFAAQYEVSAMGAIITHDVILMLFEDYAFHLVVLTDTPMGSDRTDFVGTAELLEDSVHFTAEDSEFTAQIDNGELVFNAPDLLGERTSLETVTLPLAEGVYGLFTALYEVSAMGGTITHDIRLALVPSDIFFIWVTTTTPMGEQVVEFYGEFTASAMNIDFEPIESGSFTANRLMGGLLEFQAMSLLGGMTSLETVTLSR